MTDGPVLEVNNLVKHYRGKGQIGRRGRLVRAVEDVTLTVGPGEVLGLVGESGSGKSTVGKCIARLIKPTSGRISLLGEDISELSRGQMRSRRRDIHMVFQDPYSSLNPRMTIGDIVAEPLRQHGIARGAERRLMVAEMLEKSGLRAEMRSRYPHELSGGQRQRVALARALVLNPKFVVADEPVSALDVSVQAAILNLLLDLQKDLGFSCLFITHDLSVVEFISDRIAVMYLGRIVETASREELFRDPQHPYTQALLAAAPAADPANVGTRERIVLGGDLPSQSVVVPGCSFHQRCPVAVERCRVEVPGLAAVTSPTHQVACHLVTPDGKPDLAHAVRPTA
ncbi:oligopeptide/dipeptide ABC transporter ATP-binding protein [Kribbella sp. NPDC048915]|uniref:ABC transporter ATP-binding protein n=1 Tax=Kribbella sp. NPDC048915 TaxID=3155148 RepID=UPI0033FAFC0E